MENVMFEGEYWFHSSLWNAETTMSLKLSARSWYKNLNLISLLFLFVCFFSPGRILRIHSKHYFKKIVQISQHFFCVSFRNSKEKENRWNHRAKAQYVATVQKCGAVLVQCLESVPSVFCFFFVLFCCFPAGSLWGVCSLFGAQSQNGRVSDCRGPHRLLPDISVPSLVGDTKWNLWMALQVSGQVFMGFYGSSSVRQRAEASS